MFFNMNSFVRAIFIVLCALALFSKRLHGSINSDYTNGLVQNLPSRPATIQPDLQTKKTYFDDSVSRNYVVQEGETAYMTCRVKNLGLRTVSWIRQSDYHILTVGEFTYANDVRFSAFHRHQTDDWILEIKYTNISDSGTYECHVNTEQKISHQIYLQVIVARAVIKGSPDLFVKVESSIRLECRVNPPTVVQSYVFWYHNGNVINYDNIDVRHGDRLQIEKPFEDFNTVSSLRINNIDPQDSGNYTCKPSNALKATIRLHVSQGETSAAMQREHTSLATPSSTNRNDLQITIVLLLFGFMANWLR